MSINVFSNRKVRITSVSAECILQFLLIMMGAFAILAWFGSLIDNLLLTYLIG